ncbi:ankyrin repeat-containing domain protein [Mycena filopes]|nr:ankyrin repeat-containing domain protein [Mycena filopes]
MSTPSSADRDLVNRRRLTRLEYLPLDSVCQCRSFWSSPSTASLATPSVIFKNPSPFTCVRIFRRIQRLVVVRSLGHQSLSASPLFSSQSFFGIVSLDLGLAKFLLAKLHTKALAKQRTVKKVRAALENLPKTLAETYADAIRRIDTQSEEDREIAQAVLTWVTHAKQILSVADLRVALSIEPGAKELDVDDLLDIETILGVCAGLIIVDEHLSVVRLVHYTTQEYMDSISWQHFPGAQTKITQSLLTFLSFDSIWNLITCGYHDTLKESELPPLLQYCQYCLTHAAGEPEKNVELQSMLLKFIHQVPFWLGFAQRFWDPWWWRHTPKEPSSLFVAATTNLLDIGGILIEQGQYSRNMAEELGSASVRGHYDMVRLLVASGADVNAQWGWYGNGNALQAAVVKGHKELVQLLLDHGAKVNVQGGDYGNALQAAAVMGHKELVELLVDHGAEVNKAEYDNALEVAAATGHKEIVQLLIAHGAEVNAHGGDYANALQIAAVEGHKEIVQLLIEHGANVNVQGGDYGNALQTAETGGTGRLHSCSLSKVPK